MGETTLFGLSYEERLSICDGLSETLEQQSVGRAAKRHVDDTFAAIMRRMLPELASRDIILDAEPLPEPEFTDDMFMVVHNALERIGLGGDTLSKCAQILSTDPVIPTQRMPLDDILHPAFS